MKTARALLLFAVACLFVAGCGDDEPSRPKGGSTPRTISNIWPNEDGRSWTYEFAQRVKADWGPVRLYQTAADVPPAPTMDEVVALLDSNPLVGPADTTLGFYTLQFTDSITTASGVTAQYLRESLEIPGRNPVGAEGPSFERALLTRLMLARPDLRDAIAARAGSGVLPWLPRGNHVAGGLISTQEYAPRDPLLVHGYAWRKTDRWIGTYGDLDTLLAWKFVEAPLVFHHEFTHQLVPVLADDLYEHCRILGGTSVSTVAGLFTGALECLYMIDYGVMEYGSVISGPIGYTRFFDYGTVIYAPGVGPVYSYERWMVQPGDSITNGFGDLTISLIDAAGP